jgi:hypothetical protein
MPGSRDGSDFLRHPEAKKAVRVAPSVRPASAFDIPNRDSDVRTLMIHGLQKETANVRAFRKGAKDGLAFVASLNYDVLRGSTVSP